MDGQNLAHNDDFVMADVFTRALRYWWLVFVLMFAGGLVGFLASSIQKPLYESTAHITTVIDYAYAGRLTDYEEDHLLSAIGDIITSDEVLRKTSTAIVEQGLASGADEARAGLSAVRQGFRWQLTSQYYDPLIAQSINQVWLSASMDALEELRLESLVALTKLSAQAEVEACFQQAVNLEPVSPYCTIEEMRSLLADLEGTANIAASDSMLSMLLASRISYQVTQNASLPEKPVRFATNISVLAGAVIGLILALTFFILGFPAINPRVKKK